MYKSKKPYLTAPAAASPPCPGASGANGTGSITINGRDIDDYFGLDTLKLLSVSPWSLPAPWARSTSWPPSPAAALPARPAPSVTALPAPCCR